MKCKIYLGLMALSLNALSQQNPTNNSPIINGNNNNQFWSRGGNFGGVFNNNNNIFGTLWNSPIHTVTDGTQRTILNGSKPAQIINTFVVNTSGFMGIGRFGGNSSIDNANGGPWTMLHLEGPNNSGPASVGGGFRPWMSTGITIKEHSDALYVGMWAQPSQGLNRSDAVINWSDDDAAPFGPDQLRVVMTGVANSPGLRGANGMDVARFSPNGNIGVGNFAVLGTNPSPVRRLEILDADPNSASAANANAPQLRISYTYNATPTAGVFTEFQTTNLGDMYFNTRANGTARRFGFHDNTPGNTVEITANGSSPIPVAPNGSSGLRFTNLTTAATPQANPGPGVLSVNATGDVIYVPGGGLANGNNGISVTAGTAQLGVACSVANIPAIVANQFTANRMIANRNFDFWFASLNNETGGVGIGGQPVLPFCGTGNTFEVSANSKNPQYGSTGASGVRFTKLPSSSATIPNGTNGVNSAKVLTVDGDGDVVLTDAIGSGSAFGNLCSATQNPLPADFEIPLNQHNYYFSGQGKAVTNVGMGLPCGTPLYFAKLQVYQATRNDMFNPGISMAGEFDNVATGVNSFGIYSTATGAANTNIGVYANAANATTQNIAIYGTVANSSGTTPPTGPDYAGYFNGDVVRTGTDNFTSDFNLKKNIDTIAHAMVIINQLKPKTFEYKKSSYPSMNLPSGKQYGLIAQDVQTVLPELVNNNIHPAKLDSVGNVIVPSVNYLSLEYQQLIGIMLKGMQEQQAQIKRQDSLITALISQVNGCCSSNSARHGNATINQLDIELSDKDAIVLNQNVPNPFAEQTTITYNVPSTVEKAQIIFYNSAGQIIQTVDVKTRGKGKVNVFAADLSSGLYHYTLVADGKVVDSKKMVRE